MLLSTMVGCASAPPTLQVSDVQSLSGKWLGNATYTGAGAPNPIELTINPDGTYTSRTAAQLQTGTVTIRDGKISFVRTTAAGSSTASTAVLQERGGKRVLVGQGQAVDGPYSYEFTEQK
jgi:hypothetical protein